MVVFTLDRPQCITIQDGVAIVEKVYSKPVQIPEPDPTPDQWTQYFQYLER